jgi:hypothetical protein
MATLLLSAAGSFVGGAIGGPLGATIGRAVGAIAGSVVDQAIIGALTPARKVQGRASPRSTSRLRLKAPRSPDCSGAHASPGR